MKTLTLGLFILTLSLTSSTIYKEFQPDLAFKPQDLTSPFVVSLDTESSFDISVESYTASSGQKSFCNALPSQITSKVTYNSTIPLLGGASFDNIIYFNGDYFLLDTTSWTVLVASNLTDSKTYKYIEIDTSSHDISRPASSEIPFLVLDTDLKVLYIIRSDILVYYPLADFYTARKNNADIPKTWTKMVNLRPFRSIKIAKYYKKHLYLVYDDSKLRLMQTIYNTQGYQAPTYNTQYTFNATFFGLDEEDEVGVVDVAFKDDYAYILDELHGVHVMSLQSPSAYVNVPSLSIPLLDGRSIEIAGDALVVITITKRSTTLHEYSIVSSPTLSLTLNREIELKDAIRSTVSDSNFLYLISGSENLASKHSVTGAYNSDALKKSYSSYWYSDSSIGAVISTEDGVDSNLVVLDGKQITVSHFTEAKATLTCGPAVVMPGTYTYSIKSMQRSCRSKERDTAATSTDICEIHQVVSITIDSQTIMQAESPRDNTGLIVGLSLGGVFVVVAAFAFWHSRMRKKEQSPTLRNDVFFRRLSRSPLNGEISALNKSDGSGHPDAKQDEIIIDHQNEQEHDHETGNQIDLRKSSDGDSPKKVNYGIARGKTFSEIGRNDAFKVKGEHKVVSLSKLENNHYEGEI